MAGVWWVYPGGKMIDWSLQPQSAKVSLQPRNLGHYFRALFQPLISLRGNLLDVTTYSSYNIQSCDPFRFF